MSANLPQHLAIIMDGNGRWAQQRGRSRTHGHLRGARVAKNIITAAVQEKIQYLTLFTFSNENWFRPEAEVSFLMKLLARQISREQSTLMKNNIKFKIIGELGRLPLAVQKIVSQTIELTEKNTGMTLVFALSYGGRQEIVHAAKLLAKKAATGEISVDAIDEASFSQNLESNFLPDPDLIIRTSGEQRLSNFFLWQAAYAEIYILDKLWPDYSETDFRLALEDYALRNRRFGRVTTPALPIIPPPHHELLSL